MTDTNLVEGCHGASSNDRFPSTKAVGFKNYETEVLIPSFMVKQFYKTDFEAFLTLWS